MVKPIERLLNNNSLDNCVDDGYYHYSILSSLNNYPVENNFILEVLSINDFQKIQIITTVETIPVRYYRTMFNEDRSNWSKWKVLPVKKLNTKLICVIKGDNKIW